MATNMQEDSKDIKLNESWIDVSKDLMPEVKDSDDDDFEDDCVTGIMEILNIDINNLDDLTLLKYQSYVASYLRKYIKNIPNANFDDDKLYQSYVNDFVPKLKWLFSVTEYFCKKQKVKIFTHRSTLKNNEISRSSYKFCNNTYKCKYRYDGRYDSNCRAHHIVHHMVYADIEALLSHCQQSREQISIKEIIKSMNTISFVLTHMYNELYNINTISKATITRSNDFDHGNQRKNQKKNNKIQKAKIAVVDQDGWQQVVPKKGKRNVQ